MLMLLQGDRGYTGTKGEPVGILFQTTLLTIC